MIDIHAHVLPSVDDGSKSMDETLALLTEEEKLGVTDVICTPHLRTKYRAEKPELVELVDKVQKIATDKGLKIKLHLGRELYVSKHYKSNVKNFSATMPNEKYVLIEYNFGYECEIVETVYELSSMGLIPIVAHPERYSYITLSDIEELKSLGALIQINAESVTASLFSRSGRFAKKLLSKGLVDFVASDIHYGRKNCLGKAYSFVSLKHGKEYANQIFKENAKKIIEG